LPLNPCQVKSLLTPLYDQLFAWSCFFLPCIFEEHVLTLSSLSFPPGRGCGHLSIPFSPSSPFNLATLRPKPAPPISFFQFPLLDYIFFHPGISPPVILFVPPSGTLFRDTRPVGRNPLLFLLASGPSPLSILNSQVPFLHDFSGQNIPMAQLPSLGIPPVIFCTPLLFKKFPLATSALKSVPNWPPSSKNIISSPLVP